MRLIIILSILSLIACNKSEIELKTLPPVTETGTNTFGMNVGWRTWITNGKYCSNQYGNCRDNPKANYYTNGSSNNVTMGFTADRVIYKGLGVSSSESFAVSFYRNFSGTGIYHLKKDDSYSNVQFDDHTNNKYYELLQERETFELYITKFDTISKIISGRFSGILFNQYDPNDSINVHKGRFDIKLQ